MAMTKNCEHKEMESKSIKSEEKIVNKLLSDTHSNLLKIENNNSGDSLEKVLNICKALPELKTKDWGSNLDSNSCLISRLRNIHQMLMIDGASDEVDVENFFDFDMDFADKLEERIQKEKSESEASCSSLGCSDTEKYFHRKKLKLKSLVAILSHELQSATKLIQIFACV